MNFTMICAVLVALLLSLPALAYKQHRIEIRRSMRWTLRNPLVALNDLLMGETGTATILYDVPVSGATAPTAIQASQTQVVIVEVGFGDADTTALVTHNYGLQTQTFTPNTGQNCPIVTKTDKNLGTAYPSIQFAWTNGNAITLTKNNTSTGSGCTVVLYIHRPHSIGQ